MADKPHELEFFNSDIWVINADGTGLTQLTLTGSGTFEREPRWIDNTTLLIEQKIGRNPKQNIVLTLRRRQ